MWYSNPRNRPYVYPVRRPMTYNGGVKGDDAGHAQLRPQKPAGGTYRPS